ncbi:glutamate receptor 2.8-like [Vigna unguiculata]|uniref:glutamate receptor 2.8-like n=1 Tax=Vigna unguiculata TaxID=3917 RepID=UPI001016FF8B|nr:glutamate receptor 2.8-like [Vigna unguiculata]
MKGKCFLSLLTWSLIVLLVLLEAPTGNGSNGRLENGEIKLTVRVPVRDGFPQFVKVVWDPSQQKYTASGYCMDVFNAAVTYLPFNVSLHLLPAAVESSYGFRFDQALQKQIPPKNEVVVGDVTILANRSNYADFTVPYTASGVKMVVPAKHGRDQNMWTFVKPFSWDLWLSIIIISTFIGLAILIMERNVNALPNQEGSPNQTKLGPATILLFPISQAILPEREVVVKGCSRFVLMVWLVLAFVLMQSYTANLTSILTLDQLQPSFLNVNDLRREGYYVGYQGGSFVYDVLIDRFKFDPSRLRPYNNTGEYHDALKLGSKNGGVAAIFDEVPYLKLYLQEYGSNYIMSGPEYRNAGFGFVFPLNSNLTAYFSRAILNVIESGLMNEIEEKYFGEDSSEETSSSEPLSLSFRSFAGLFIISGISTLLALLVSERFIWRRLILMAKALTEIMSAIHLFKKEARTHPIQDSTHGTEA